MSSEEGEIITRHQYVHQQLENKIHWPLLEIRSWDEILWCMLLLYQDYADGTHQYVFGKKWKENKKMSDVLWKWSTNNFRHHIIATDHRIFYALSLMSSSGALPLKTAKQRQPVVIHKLNQWTLLDRFQCNKCVSGSIIMICKTRYCHLILHFVQKWHSVDM